MKEYCDCFVSGLCDGRIHISRWILLISKGARLAAALTLQGSYCKSTTSFLSNLSPRCDLEAIREGLNFSQSSLLLKLFFSLNMATIKIKQAFLVIELVKIDIRSIGIGFSPTPNSQLSECTFFILVRISWFGDTNDKARFVDTLNILLVRKNE